MENLTLNSLFVPSTSDGGYWTGGYYEPYKEIVYQYYPVYCGYWENKSKIEQAFKIIQKLIELKHIKLEKVKDFIELVNSISEIL